MSKTYSDMLFPSSVSGDSDDASIPNCDSSRINVGWLTTEYDVQPNIDESIVEYMSNLGKLSYNFVVYPVGGAERAFWIKTKEKYDPPEISLPDLQLANHLWETYICGRISPWIDCDSEDPTYAEMSRTELLKELNYACYLGLRTITITLHRKKSPKLADIINKWLWTKSFMFTLWVCLPSFSEIIDVCPDDSTDLWTIWSDFRTLCSNYVNSKFKVALTISDIEDEFIDRKLLDRWNAEPVGAIIVSTDAFKSSRNGVVNLPISHVNVLKKLWFSDALRLIVKQANKIENRNMISDYSKLLKYAVKDVSINKRKEACIKDGFLADANIDYYDVLQAPLQPLSDNLDSGVYNTFEQDPIKYKRYGEAVESALRDIGESNNRPNSVVVYLLGGGRGPLATACLEAEKRYNNKFRPKKDKLKIKLYVVEKNSNAVVTLKYINKKGWKNRATIIETDMRSLPNIAKERGYEQPDIIVSELLGSFGDNELSPECLDGVTEFLKPTTISIPYKYTSYAAPIMSLFMHQTIKSTSPSYYSKGVSGHGRVAPVKDDDGSYTQRFPQGELIAKMDEIYVVYLRQFCPLAESKPVFTFEHPNFENSSNERSISLEFDIDRRCDIMGFAGYFDMFLYKDIMLSIDPKTFSEGMISWFPAVIPLRDLERVEMGEKVRLNMERRVDKDGVWYEWCMEVESTNGKKRKTPVQNKNGESYYMRK